MKLLGKVAIVTGSSRGIGKAIALEMARQGADIVVAARTEPPQLEKFGTVYTTADLVRGLGRRVLPIVVELSKDDEIKALVETAVEEFGRVDILVNNAALGGRYATVVDSNVADWDKVMAVNIRAPYVCSKLVAPHMIKLGGGVIINLIAGSAREERAARMVQMKTHPLAFDVSKAALMRFTAGLAEELRSLNIAVVGMDPGFTLTERWQAGQAAGNVDVSQAHTLDAPAKAATFLATENPMQFSGKNVEAAEIIKKYHLI